MTTEEFLAELETVSSHFDWTLRPDTGRHAERRAHPRLHLQASPKGEPSAIFDLLGAVCYAQMGKAFEVRSWPEAARALGLAPAHAARLLAAAHDRTWEENEDGKRQPVAEMIALRKQMLDATGVLLRHTAATATATA